MKITFLGMNCDAIVLLKILEEKISANYLGISSNARDLREYTGDKILFRLQPSIDAAVSRILPKIEKRTKDADIVFLFSEICGKGKEDIICDIAEELENETVVSVVWYPKQKHGQRGISNTLERLGECSAVVAIPQTTHSKLPELVPKYVEQILRMYQLPYVNEEADIGKRVISNGGLLHLIQEDLEIAYLNHRAEGLPWSISSICYNRDLDTGLDCGCNALLHLTVFQETDPSIIQYICEYVFSRIGEEGELNFSITVTPEPQDFVGVDLLVTDVVTLKESQKWF